VIFRRPVRRETRQSKSHRHVCCFLVESFYPIESRKYTQDIATKYKQQINLVCECGNTKIETFETSYVLKPASKQDPSSIQQYHASEAQIMRTDIPGQIIEHTKSKWSIGELL